MGSVHIHSSGSPKYKSRISCSWLMIDVASFVISTVSQSLESASICDHNWNFLNLNNLGSRALLLLRSIKIWWHFLISSFVGVVVWFSRWLEYSFIVHQNNPWFIWIIYILSSYLSERDYLLFFWTKAAGGSFGVSPFLLRTFQYNKPATVTVNNSMIGPNGSLQSKIIRYFSSSSAMGGFSLLILYKIVIL